jgi:hypothetical protein
MYLLNIHAFQQARCAQSADSGRGAMEDELYTNTPTEWKRETVDWHASLLVMAYLT